MANFRISNPSGGFILGLNKGMSAPDHRWPNESSESEGEAEHSREEREFILYREKIRKHNKDRLKARQHTSTPFNLNSNSSYGALELAFANNKSISRRIWRKKNIYLEMQNSSAAEGDNASAVGRLQDVQLQPNVDAQTQAPENGQADAQTQAPEVNDNPTSLLRTIWNGSRNFLQDFYEGAWEVLSGNWNYAD